MFWKFNLVTSHIDTLLDKEDVRLQEILDEDDVLQECKAQNRRLVDFLVRPDNIEELVNLVTQEPSDEADEKTKYKYSNAACELLTSDVVTITDKLAGDDTLVGKVYSFLEAEGPLNPLLSSFFSKVMGLLITRKSEMMLDFLKSKDDFVGLLLHHMGTSAIMDLLLRLITCIESQECRNACISWLNQQNLIQKMIAMIDPSQAGEKHCNASQSLCDIIRLTREQMSQLQEKAGSDPLLAVIESQETVTELLNHMFDGELNESVLVNGLAVIQTLLEFRKISPEGLQEQMTSLDAERLAQGVSSTLLAIKPRLKNIHQILQDPPKQHYSPMPTTKGTLDPPLGNTRLQSAKLISTIVLTNTHSVNVELANLGTIEVLLDLYFKYCWNNFLHAQIEQCLATILNNTPTEGEDKSEQCPLLTQLFSEVKVLEKIIDFWEDNDQQQSRPGGHRKGYMGHLTRIANHIIESMEKGTNAEKIKELLEETSEEVRERWKTFTSGALAEMNKQNTVELFGGRGLHSSSEDDDPDFRDIPFPQGPDTAMQQAFSDYQLQQMTSNFIDQFGFNEDEFTEQEEQVDMPFKISSINFDINTDENQTAAAALFDQACNERMQQFDEADSDEDLWEGKEVTFSQTGNTEQSQLQATDGSINKTSEDEDSEGSTDSEEELDSPRRIYQTPSTDTEKMEIESSENWPNFEDKSGVSAPVAMDTGSPWENTTKQPEGNDGSNWAKFDDLPGNEVESEENWANFQNDRPSDPTSPDPPQPRSSSPVAMDTNDSSSRTAPYLVTDTQDEPKSDTDAKSAESKNDELPDNRTEEESGESHFQDKTEDSPGPVVADNTNVEQTGHITETQDTLDTNFSEDSKNKMETEKSDTTHTTLNTDDKTVANQATNEAPSVPCINADPVSSCTDPPKTTEQDQLVTDSDKMLEVEVQSSVCSQQDPPCCRNKLGNVQKLEEDDNYELDDDDDDLSANFNFLASSGLMKSGSEESTDSDTKSTDDGVKEMRAQAKEALDQYAAEVSQNGPV